MVAATELGATAPAGAAPVKQAPFRALASWVLFDWAAQPFYTLVLTFLFAPYFANVVVGDPTQGQALWGYAAAVAGVIIAIGSPLLGAQADGRGRRKPWIALFAVIFMAALSALWLAKPGLGVSASVLGILLAFVIATVAVEFMTVFTNSIMPQLVPREKLGSLSGIAWGIGYLGGLVSLAVMAGLIVTNPATGKTLFGMEPVLRLDAVLREGDRLVGPFAAAWFLLFILPFFLFVPDRQVMKVDTGKSAVQELMSTLRELPGHPNVLLFLVARAIYVDGISAIFAFGGIYGAAVFGWQAFELGLFGIILTITGAIGSFAGGFLDDKRGSKWVILVSLLILMAGSLGILSVDRTHVLFVQEVLPKAAGSGPFSSTGEHAFLVFAMMVGLVAASVQSASRALLAKLAPPDKMTQFFGLFAFSGKVTAFLAPLLVAQVTQTLNSQRAGMAVIVGFLVVGFVLMIWVRERPGQAQSQS